MTTRQDQFKAEMAALFAKYGIEMDVVEKTSGYDSYVVGVNFWSYTQYDKDGNVIAEPIDFQVGSRAVDHTDFE